MVAPTFVLKAETTWTTQAATTKTTASFSVLAGDVLVACMQGDQVSTVGTLTASGGSLTWTQRIAQGTGSQTETTIATAVVDTNKSMTATVTKGSGSFTVTFGMTVLVFRGVASVGATAGVNGGPAAPTVNITTTAANSAVIVSCIDGGGGDGTTRTWRANAGALTEQTYDREVGSSTHYVGYHADSGAIGTDAVGLTAPSMSAYALAAVELLGSVAAGRTTLNIHSFGLGMQHGMGFGMPAGGRYLP
jgi:hypothetical protein